MAFKFCSLSSGSSGNCQYIETDNIRVLVDAGLSGKKIENLLSDIGVDAETIDHILITHEHRDHIKGAGILSRRYDIPIWANEKTWTSMEGLVGELKEKNIKVFNTEKNFQLKDLNIYPFQIFHDAIEPVGFCLYNNNTKISIITDTGIVNNDIKSKIKDSALYLIESNHDVEMLKVGRYPWNLKKRIMSSQGHLSNEQSGEVLSDIISGNGEVVLLGHLSQENNFPLLAYETVKNIIEGIGVNVHKDITLELTHREKVTKVFNF